MANKEYWHPDYTNPISIVHLRSAEKDFQKEVMKEWFLANYENPAEHTPYESAEGGYIYIWGGPYDAKEQLFNQFGEIIAEETIDEVAEELEEQEGCTDWSGTIDADDFDDYLLETIADNTEFCVTFKQSIANIEALLELDIDEYLKQNLFKLLYVNVITAIETYLSDAFMNTVLQAPSLIRRFVETNPDFKQRKLTLNEIYNRVDSLIDEVKTYLLDLQYHNLGKIKPMYKSTLNVDFPQNLTTLFTAIKIRHDIVHRNGKTKDGSIIGLSKDDVVQLIGEAYKFIDFIDLQLAKKSNIAST